MATGPKPIGSRGGKIFLPKGAQTGDVRGLAVRTTDEGKLRLGPPHLLISRSRPRRALPRGVLEVGPGGRGREGGGGTGRALGRVSEEPRKTRVLVLEVRRMFVGQILVPKLRAKWQH